MVYDSYNVPSWLVETCLLVADSKRDQDQDQDQDHDWLVPVWVPGRGRMMCYRVGCGGKMNWTRSVGPWSHCFRGLSVETMSVGEM